MEWTYLVPIGRRGAGIRHESSERMMKADTYCKDYEVTSSRLHAHPRCNTINRVTNEVPMTPIQIQLQTDLRFNTN